MDTDKLEGCFFMEELMQYQWQTILVRGNLFDEANI